MAAFLREGTKCLLKKYPVYSWRRTEPSTGADSAPARGLPADGAASGAPERAKAEVLGRGEGSYPSAPQPRGAKTASPFLTAFLPLDIA